MRLKILKKLLMFSYEHARPAIGADCVILRLNGDETSYEILLIKRKNAPFQGKYALPGGFFDMEDANIEATAARELLEETGLTTDLQLLNIFSEKDRDPRERVMSVAFLGMVERDAIAIAGDDAEAVAWIDVNDLEELAFDHEDIVIEALEYLTGDGEDDENFTE